jgi:hypothetical protein
VIGSSPTKEQDLQDNIVLLFFEMCNLTYVCLAFFNSVFVQTVLNIMSSVFAYIYIYIYIYSSYNKCIISVTVCQPLSSPIHVIH